MYSTDHEIMSVIHDSSAGTDRGNSKLFRVVAYCVAVVRNNVYTVRFEMFSFASFLIILSIVE